MPAKRKSIQLKSTATAAGAAASKQSPPPATVTATANAWTDQIKSYRENGYAVFKPNQLISASVLELLRAECDALIRPLQSGESGSAAAAAHDSLISSGCVLEPIVSGSLSDSHPARTDRSAYDDERARAIIKQCGLIDSNTSSGLMADAMERSNEIVNEFLFHSTTAACINALLQSVSDKSTPPAATTATATATAAAGGAAPVADTKYASNGSGGGGGEGGSAGVYFFNEHFVIKPPSQHQSLNPPTNNNKRIKQNPKPHTAATATAIAGSGGGDTHKTDSKTAANASDAADAADAAESDDTSAFAWHNDAREQLLMCLNPPDTTRYVSLWCALDDMSVENGTLRILPGAVRFDTEPDPSTRDAEAVVMTVPAGSVIAFASTLWHASGHNRSDCYRRAYYAQFSQFPLTESSKSKTPIANAIPIPLPTTPNQK